LPGILEAIPTHLPQVVLGRSFPNWAYCAAADRLRDARVSFFAPQFGEIPIVRVRIGAVTAVLEFRTCDCDTFTHLSCRIPGEGGRLDPAKLSSIVAPSVLRDRGLVIEGVRPSWLCASLMYGYRDHVRWIAIYEPRLKGGVVVMRTGDPDPNVGDVVPLDGSYRLPDL
jgi:CRISPR-associated Csx3 family protein